MEEFFAECRQAKIGTNYLEVPTSYSEEDQGDLDEQLQRFLEKGLDNE